VWREETQLESAANAQRTNTAKAQLLHCDKYGVSLYPAYTEASADNTNPTVSNCKGRMESKKLCAEQNLKYINFEAGDRVLGNEPQHGKSSFQINDVIFFNIKR
jgi:topoisomerase IA-like protein